MRERASQVALAHTGCAGDEDRLVLLDASTRGELPDDRFVELALGGVVDVLDAGLTDLELGLAQGALEASVLAMGPFGAYETQTA